MAFWIYVLRCSDDSYYTGHTDNLEQRIAQHNAGKGSDYTCRRRPLQLAFAERFGTRDEARAAEQQVKGWSRAKKQALFVRDWEKLHELSKSYQLGRLAERPSTTLRTDGFLGGEPPSVLSAVEGPVLSAVEGPVLSAVEGPVLSAVEGPVLSAVEGPFTRKIL